MFQLYEQFLNWMQILYPTSTKQMYSFMDSCNSFDTSESIFYMSCRSGNINHDAFSYNRNPFMIKCVNLKRKNNSWFKLGKNKSINDLFLQSFIQYMSSNAIYLTLRYASMVPQPGQLYVTRTSRFIKTNLYLCTFVPSLNISRNTWNTVFYCSNINHNKIKE